MRVVWGLIFLHYCIGFQKDYNDNFPAHFQFGVVTSAYQTEGAWNLNGNYTVCSTTIVATSYLKINCKGESIWDKAVRIQPNRTSDNSTGDISCDSYHKYEEDVTLVKNLNVNFYRFSLSWSRILPTGQTNKINKDGLRFYNDLIDTLISNGIQPYVTIFDWDLPQPLQELGGFANHLVIKHFVDYSKVVFENFGDRVKLWVTFNEPKSFCMLGYGSGEIAPLVHSPGFGEYICAHNIIKAHAQTYHLYHVKFKPQHNGRISINLDAQWQEANSTLKNDIEAADRMMEFELGWFANPIYHPNGDYPEVMKKFVAERSRKEGYSSSRLPEFTPGEIEYIQGTFDFFGINYFTTQLVVDKEYPVGEPGLIKDANVRQFADERWETSASPWLYVFPWGFRKILSWIKLKYDDPEILVLENGFSDHGQLDDFERIRYLELHLNALLQAIHVDNVFVTTYAVWSLVDNFEWFYGYTQKFGLYHVDFADPNRSRTLKASGKYFRDVVAKRKLTFSNLTFWNCL